MTEEAANFIPISEVCDTPVHYVPRIILQFERSISYTRFQCYWPALCDGESTDDCSPVDSPSQRASNRGSDILSDVEYNNRVSG